MNSPRFHASVFAALMLFATGVFQTIAQGVILFDTHNEFVDARVWHPEKCEPISGSEYLAQLYIEHQGKWNAIGVPVPFGTGLDAGYIEAGEVTVPFATPGTYVFATMRLWSGNFDTYELAEAAQAPHGKTAQIYVWVGGSPFAAGPLIGMDTFWGGCPAEVSMRVEISETTLNLYWKTQGFQRWTVFLPQVSDSPNGPWHEIEGPWITPTGKSNPPNPVILPKSGDTKFYRMRITSNLDP